MAIGDIHHLDVGTLCPPAGRLLNDRGHLVCHALLVETVDGLVAVDTGMGTGDVADPAGTLGRAFTSVVRPRISHATTLLAQVEGLGVDPREVRHLALTHLDLDHAGGMPDFPDAAVHARDTEIQRALTRTTRAERERYRPAHVAHGPKWVTAPTAGDDWYGFTGVHEVVDGVVTIPLLGHSLGHQGVAVRRGDGWLLHAGDAYFHHREVDPTAPYCSPGLRVFQTLVQADGALRHHNQQRLRELVAAHGDEVTVFCAHDPTAFELLGAGT